MSVVLVAIGLYGVMAWSVTRRTTEIGVRVALGAGTGTVIGMVLREGLQLVVAGAISGLVFAFLLSRVIATLLFGITPRDAFAGALMVMLMVTVVATLLPALRAARIDPVVALRGE